MYVNGRPVDFLQSLYKGLEELFRQWSSFGKYVCILNLKLPFETADISSTPDKRHLFMKEEGRLVDAIVKHINGKMQTRNSKPKDV
jgi:DNA mismatch repair ATPase MutL